jgi:hypothetical protein
MSTLIVRARAGLEVGRPVLVVYFFCFTLSLFWFLQLSSGSIGFSICFFGGDVFLELFLFQFFQNSTFFKKSKHFHD